MCLPLPSVHEAITPSMPILTQPDIMALVFAAVASPHLPKSFKDAKVSAEWEHWQGAIQKELDNLEKYKVYEVVPRQDWMRILRAAWVFTRKLDDKGQPGAYKARFVADGRGQAPGRDYVETHASVAHKASHRVLLAIACALDYEVDTVDIKAAFLNGVLKEEIFLEAPQGSGISRDRVIRLLRTLYGIHQAPREWNAKIDAWLRSQGFIPTDADPCVYRRDKEGHVIMMSLHVDDQMLISSSRPHLDQFKRDLNAAFETTDNGPISFFLAFHVTRDRPNRKLWISVEHYLATLLSDFDLDGVNAVKNPLPPGISLSVPSDDEFASSKHLPYRTLVAAILYAAQIARPDLLQPAALLARHLNKWGDAHWKALKHLCRYIKGTLNMALLYDGPAGERVLYGFADANWGGCPDTLRSTTGYLFRVFGNNVSYRSIRQATTAMSTAEAEYMASSDATREAIWLRRLLDGLKLLPPGPTTIYNDNMGTIALSKNPVNHDRAKHIDLRVHFLREHCNAGTVDLVHVPSADNVADGFTKVQPVELFLHNRDAMGLAPRPGHGGV